MLRVLSIVMFITNNKSINGFKLLSNNKASFSTRLFSSVSSSLPTSISWYPGHIAKAERELADYIKKVDVVIEVRDARIPLSTTHPMVPEWVGNRPLIVAIARLDQISKKALDDWKEYYAMNPAHPSRPDAKVYFVDGKLGAGIITLKKQAMKAGYGINEKRVKRGMQPRAVRAAVIGFPNVGKSAIINRLLGRKMAKSMNLPGVTRSLQWVRLGGTQLNQEETIELLDSPGIIPAKALDQNAALLLAVCNDIGEASYDRVIVAAELCNLLNAVHAQQFRYVDMPRILARYDIPFNKMTGEEIVYEIAQKLYLGNSVSAADKILGDFRRGFMGKISLEIPPMLLSSGNGRDVRRPPPLQRKHLEDEEGDEVVEESEVEGDTDSYKKKKLSLDLDIGKGNYDGW